MKTTGKPLKSMGSLKLGDVVAIPLGDGRFSFGRIYHGAVGIYSGTSAEFPILSALARRRPRRFFYYAMLPGSRGHFDWLFVGRLPFVSGEDSDAPPMSASDPIFHPGRHRLYHKGFYRDVTEAETCGLQHYTIHAPQSIREALLGNRKDPWRKAKDKAKRFYANRRNA